MKTIVILIVFFFIFNICLINGEECSQTSTPNFTIDGYTFLQSPNFPQTLYSNATSSSCNANLIAKNKNDYLWIVMINGAASGIEILGYKNNVTSFFFDSFDSNNDNPIFSPLLNNLNFKVFSNASTWVAFQAAVVTYDPLTVNSTCPLSGSNIFDFIKYPDIIIPISSNYDNDQLNETIIKTCTWNFKISSAHQQLKVEIYDTGIDTVSLILYADGNLIYKFNDSITTLYFNGDIFSLVFTYNDSIYAQFEVLAFVSVVERSSSFTSEGCQMMKYNDSATVFTNVDYVNGYPSYQYCNHIINIPINHEANIGLYETNYEACCDYVTLNYLQNNKNITFKWDLNKLEYYCSIKSEASGSHLSFTSDGNVQEAGYKAILKVYECICGNQEYFVECNKNVRITPLSDNINFCDNMNCTYNIYSNCPNQYFRLDPHMDALREMYDDLLLLQNGKVVKNYTGEDYDDGYEIFLHNNNFTLNFNSGIAPENVSYEKFWYLDFIPFNPSITKVILDTAAPNHAIWIANINENDAYTVCTKSGALEIFITVDPSNPNIGLRNFYLYDDDGFENYVGRLSSALTSSSNFIPRSRKSASGCFTIFNSLKYDYTYYSNHTILFKTIDDSVLNCESNITVLQVHESLNFQMSSKNSGACKVSFISDLIYHGSFPYIWIYEILFKTSSTQNLTFISETNNKQFLEINPNEVHMWVDFEIFTPALSVIIPSSSNLTIEFFYSHKPFDTPGGVVQKGILASPSYLGFLNTFDSFQLPHDYGSYSTIVVKDVYGNPDAVILEYENNINIANFTLTLNEQISIKTQFELIYAENNPKENGFLIEYTLYRYNPETSTVQSSSTTAKKTTMTYTHTSVKASTLLTHFKSSIATSPFTTSYNTSSISQMTTPQKKATTTFSYGDKTTTSTTQNPNFASVTVIDISYFFHVSLTYVVLSFVF